MTDLNTYLRPPARHALPLAFVSGAILAMGASLLFLVLQEHRLVERATTRNGKLQAMQTSTKAPTASPAEQESMKKWTQLKIERDFPWPPIFSAVEKVASPDIELLEFKPDKLNRKIALNGEARNRKALVAYLDALSAQPVLKNVYLVHQQSVARDKLETIAFEIRATLRE